MSLDLLSLIVGGTASGCGAVVIYYRGVKDLFVPEPAEPEEPALEAAPPTPRFRDEYQELAWLANKQRYGRLGYVESLRFYELREKWPQLHREVRPA